MDIYTFSEAELYFLLNEVKVNVINEIEHQLIEKDMIGRHHSTILLNVRKLNFFKLNNGKVEVLEGSL